MTIRTPPPNWRATTSGINYVANTVLDFMSDNAISLQLMGGYNRIDVSANFLVLNNQTNANPLAFSLDGTQYSVDPYSVQMLQVTGYQDITLTSPSATGMAIANLYTGVPPYTGFGTSLIPSLQAGGDGMGCAPARFAMSWDDIPATAQVQYAINADTVFLSAFAGSRSIIGTAFTSPAVFTVWYWLTGTGWVQFGTVTVPSGVTGPGLCTFAFLVAAASFTVPDGSALMVIPPAPDATGANLGFTIVGNQ